ncbi:MAG: isoaspartyl peptidase/L-asparaginase family protein [bacterium]
MTQLIVHGGAGHGIADAERVRKEIALVLKAGMMRLQEQGSLEAVIQIVQGMEDNPIFNCGTGSTLNLDGEAEMDASVMTGDGRFGAVAALQRVRNPILVARKVMDETDHLLLVGDGALQFARRWGFVDWDSVTPERRKALEEMKEKGSPYFPHLHQHFKDTYSTVGAVARDDEGKLAVATSTGGITGKLPGRVGDSAICGAGTYACSWGAVSATGHGEEIIRHMLAFRTGQSMKFLKTSIAIQQSLMEKPACRVGLIGIDWRGNVGLGYSTKEMAWGYFNDEKMVLF